MKTETSAAAIVRALVEKREADAKAQKKANAEAAARSIAAHQEFWRPVLQVLAEVAEAFPDRLKVRGLEDEPDWGCGIYVLQPGKSPLFYALAHDPQLGYRLKRDIYPFGNSVYVKANSKEEFIAPLLEFIARQL